jgi:hypothetical protein
MSRRIALPGADELFRSTGDGTREESREPAAPEARDAGEISRPSPVADRAVQAVPALPPLSASTPLSEEDGDALDEAASAVRSAPRRKARAVAERRPSGRERHDEKITVYVSADELLDLEHARLALRGDHGLPVDRGRVVREALAVVLADFEAKGEASILVRRLRGR